LNLLERGTAPHHNSIEEVTMNDHSGPDKELQACVENLFVLWEDIRWVFRALPKPEKVGPMNQRWVTSPPTRLIIPRLITRAAMQPISPQERVWIMQALTNWADAYNELVAIAALPREYRHADQYLEAIESMGQCAIELRKAVTGLRRDMRRKRRKRRQHGRWPIG
jgi:hypothetical protein